MRILVIEDGPKVARALKQGLESERYNVVVATTGEEEEGFFALNAAVFQRGLIWTGGSHEGSP